MNLAEKIIKLRKQKGWSQEELALHMGVSRQSVSKWESMSSLPDLDKIIKLSGLFGVSTDFLLKDEMEEEPGFDPEDLTGEMKATSGKVRASDFEERGVKVTLEEANKYMELVERCSKKIAGAVAACIISPVFLILFTGYAETKVVRVSEDVAGAIGAAVLLVIIACAVMVFIYYGMKLSKFDYLEKEILDLEYGVAGIAEVKKEGHDTKYKLAMAFGVALCILSVVPLLVAGGFDFPDQVYITLTGLLLVFIALGVFLFVSEGMVHSCYQKILEEGDYTVGNKINNKRNDMLSTIYWCVVTAAYLGYSFVTMEWERSWIIWPVAGVLFVAVIGVANSLRKK